MVTWKHQIRLQTIYWKQSQLVSHLSLGSITHKIDIYAVNRLSEINEGLAVIKPTPSVVSTGREVLPAAGPGTSPFSKLF